MEVSVFVQGIRLELIEFWLNQLFEVGVVSDGNKGLHVELETHRWCKTDICAGREVEGAIFEFSVTTEMATESMLFSEISPLRLYMRRNNSDPPGEGHAPENRARSNGFHLRRSHPRLIGIGVKFDIRRRFSD